MSHNYVLGTPYVPALNIRGSRDKIAVHRLFFVGRNYQAHAAEMGHTVDKTKESPFYFTKAANTIVPSGSVVSYPPGTSNYHYEMELALVIGKEGLDIPRSQVHEHIFGYACGLDMTRRDLQLAARDKGRPWDLGKDFAQSSIISDVVPMPGRVIEEADISLSVNGELKQCSNLNQLIWNIREIIEDLSRFYRLQPGDVIYTGTPEGVGPVVAGDTLTGSVSGVGEIWLTVE